jgi:hypothetical protein
MLQNISIWVLYEIMEENEQKIHPAIWEIVLKPPYLHITTVMKMINKNHVDIIF